MQVESPAKIRNVALAGHNDTGKTTLASALLYTGGSDSRSSAGSRKATRSPTSTRRSRSAASRSASPPAHLPWRSHKVQLVDCPGYGIFFSETKAGLRAADAVAASASTASPASR